MGLIGAIAGLLRKGAIYQIGDLGSLPPINGKTFWVDPDLGDDDNDGLSPDMAFATLAAFVTAAKAIQAVSGYEKQRQRVLIVGGYNPVPHVHSLCDYCDYIGIGACTLGDGVGIARIGTGLTDGAVSLTATLRGAYFKNLQFLAAGGTDAFLNTGYNVLRCIFEDCTFGDNASGASAANSGFKCTGTTAGCIFRNCRIGMTNTATYCLYGIYASGQFSQNLIENCVISGVTAGVYLHTAINAVETVIRDCVIGDTGGGCAKGVDDNSNGLVILARNIIHAADAIESTQAAGTDRAIGNIISEGTAGSRVVKSEGNELVRTT